jgi:heme-degrading monooxygenase HmoA
VSRLELPEDYVVVAFVSQRAAVAAGYGEMAERMLALAREQPGFLGVEAARGADGLGITLSYWTDEAAAAAWGAHPEHREAQRLGREQWYDWYATRVWKRSPTRSPRPAAEVTAGGSPPAPA